MAILTPLPMVYKTGHYASLTTSKLGGGTSESTIPKIVGLEQVWNLDERRVKLAHGRRCKAFVFGEG